MCVLNHSVTSDSLRPFGPKPARFLCPQDFSGKSTGVDYHFPPPWDFPNLGFKLTSLMSPALQVDSLPSEPSGKLCQRWRLHIYLRLRTALQERIWGVFGVAVTYPWSLPHHLIPGSYVLPWCPVLPPSESPLGWPNCLWIRHIVPSMCLSFKWKANHRFLRSCAACQNWTFEQICSNANIQIIPLQIQ